MGQGTKNGATCYAVLHSVRTRNQESVCRESSALGGVRAVFCAYVGAMDDLSALPAIFATSPDPGHARSTRYELWYLWGNSLPPAHRSGPRSSPVWPSRCSAA